LSEQFDSGKFMRRTQRFTLLYTRTSISYQKFNRVISNLPKHRSAMPQGSRIMRGVKLPQTPRKAPLRTSTFPTTTPLRTTGTYSHLDLTAAKSIFTLAPKVQPVTICAVHVHHTCATAKCSHWSTSTPNLSHTLAFPRCTAAL
jgi:hypothetical protein